MRTSRTDIFVSQNQKYVLKQLDSPKERPEVQHRAMVMLAVEEGRGSDYIRDELWFGQRRLAHLKKCWRWATDRLCEVECRNDPPQLFDAIRQVLIDSV